jgi:hypothetical protein
MIALGVDVSTKKLAIAGIREDSTLTLHALSLDHTRRGARRLAEARSTAYAVLNGYSHECCTVMVEEPAGGEVRELLRVACVVAEAAQAAVPGALVWTVGQSSWKKQLLGHGHAGKPVTLAFAHGLGYTGDDDDLGDALCMAQLAWERWNDALGEAA